MACLSCMNNTMAADDLVMKRARSLAAMILYPFGTEAKLF